VPFPFSSFPLFFSSDERFQHRRVSPIRDRRLLRPFYFFSAHSPLQHLHDSASFAAFFPPLFPPLFSRFKTYDASRVSLMKPSSSLLCFLSFPPFRGSGGPCLVSLVSAFFFQKVRPSSSQSVLLPPSSCSFLFFVTYIPRPAAATLFRLPASTPPSCGDHLYLLLHP